jgi:3-oxoacyl-[acyl-carrier protein] reductase
VLITGATGGLGEVLVRVFDNAGFRIVIHYLKNKKKAERLARSLKNPCLSLSADLRDIHSVKRMVEIISSKMGGIDVLINNASVTIDKLLLRCSEVEWDEVIDTNLKGVFIMTKAALPIMRDGGHIVNISSCSGLRGRQGQAAYSASKAGIVGLSKSLARELSPRGIKVNVVVPGYLPVGMGQMAPDAMKRAVEESTLKRLGSPEETARFVLFLVSTETVTGQVFTIDSRL